MFTKLQATVQEVIVPKPFLPVVVALIVLSDSGPARGGWAWVCHIQPASLAINVAEQFGVTEESGARVMMGPIVLVPNLGTGPAFRFENLLAELTVGAGLVDNKTLESILYQAQAGLHYAVASGVGIGGYAGIVRFAQPQWTSEPKVVLDDATGYRVGGHVTLGQRLKYVASVGMLGVSLDAHPIMPNVKIESDHLTLRALTIDFGVRIEF